MCQYSVLETLCSSTFCLRMTHRCPIGFRFGDILGQSITFTLSFFSKALVVLEVCLGLLSCWNTALRPSFQREAIVLCFSMSQYMLAFMVPSMNCSSPVRAALLQPQTMTLPPLDCRQDTLVFALLTWWHHLSQKSLSWSHTTGHGSSSPCP